MALPDEQRSDIEHFFDAYYKELSKNFSRAELWLLLARNAEHYNLKILSDPLVFPRTTDLDFWDYDMRSKLAGLTTYMDPRHRSNGPLCLPISHPEGICVGDIKMCLLNVFFRQAQSALTEEQKALDTLKAQDNCVYNHQQRQKKITDALNDLQQKKNKVAKCLQSHIDFHDPIPIQHHGPHIYNTMGELSYSCLVTHMRHLGQMPYMSCQTAVFLMQHWQQFGHWRIRKNPFSHDDMLRWFADVLHHVHRERFEIITNDENNPEAASQEATSASKERLRSAQLIATDFINLCSLQTSGKRRAENLKPDQLLMLLSLWCSILLEDRKITSPSLDDVFKKPLSAHYLEYLRLSGRSAEGVNDDCLIMSTLFHDYNRGQLIEVYTADKVRMLMLLEARDKVGKDVQKFAYERTNAYTLSKASSSLDYVEIIEENPLHKRHWQRLDSLRYLWGNRQGIKIRLWRLGKWLALHRLPHNLDATPLLLLIPAALLGYTYLALTALAMSVILSIIPSFDAYSTIKATWLNTLLKTVLCLASTLALVWFAQTLSLSLLVLMVILNPSIQTLTTNLLNKNLDDSLIDLLIHCASPFVAVGLLQVAMRFELAYLPLLIMSIGLTSIAFFWRQTSDTPPLQQLPPSLSTASTDHQQPIPAQQTTLTATTTPPSRCEHPYPR